MYSDEFLDTLPEDVPLAIKAFCTEFFRMHAKLEKDSAKENHFRLYADAIAAFAAYCEVHKRSLNYDSPDISKFTSKSAFGPSALQLFKNVRSSVNAELEKREINNYAKSTQQQFASRFGIVFSYEFSEGELDRIQSLINELRTQIAETERFEPKHKARIMSKLEGLQREMHRHMSSLDKLWGFIGDAGVVFGKLGTDSKPFVDRVKELITITWEVQAKAEDLPTSTRLPFFPEDTEKLESNDS